MRTIKFRAWNRQLEVMVNEAIDIGKLGVHAPTMQHKDVKNRGDVYEIMQFTGLLDKNGTEIYEGDIVSCDQGQDLGFKVVGVVHYGVATRSDWPDPRIYLDARPFEKHGSEFCIFHKNPEIIGSIYSNPELIQ